MPAKTRNGCGRVAFLAHLDGIRAGLECGHSMKAVHRLYAEKVDVSYSHFTRLVHALVKKKEGQPDSRAHQPRLPLLEPDPPPRAAVAVEAEKTADTGGRRFVFDPAAVDRKQLI
jgi:hypothetical protein